MVLSCSQGVALRFIHIFFLLLFPVALVQRISSPMQSPPFAVGQPTWFWGLVGHLICDLGTLPEKAGFQVELPFPVFTRTSLAIIYTDFHSSSSKRTVHGKSGHSRPRMVTNKTPHAHYHIKSNTRFDTFRRLKLTVFDMATAL